MQGFTLFEVLIALLMLSLVTVGVLTVSNAAWRHDYDAYLLSLADIQIHNLRERFLVGAGVSDFSIWNQQNAELLPNGSGSYQDFGTYYQLRLCWRSKSVEEKCLNLKQNKNAPWQAIGHFLY